MENHPLKAILYLKFEDAEGMVPILHVPSDLSEDILTEANKHALRLSMKKKTDEDELEKFNVADLKALGMYRKWEWEDKTKYGGIMRTMLVFLFEKDFDLSEKVLNSLTSVLKYHINDLIRLEKKTAPKKKYIILLDTIKDEILDKISEK